jgi:lactoylglutathione lyase
MSRIDHLGLYVSDLERSLEFYKENFGFKEQERFQSGDAKIVALQLGNSILELIQRPGSPCAPPKGNRSHTAMKIENYDEILNNLEGKGIELRNITLEDGSRIAFLRDPDDHILEIMEKGLMN